MKTYKQLAKESTNLLGTSPSLDLMKDLLKKFYFGGEYEFIKVEDKPETYQIKNTTKNKVIDKARVIKKGNRYRFEFEG